MDDQSNYEFIRERIIFAFNDLASRLSDVDFPGEEDAAGAPFELFKMQTALLEYWWKLAGPGGQDA